MNDLNQIQNEINDFREILANPMLQAPERRRILTAIAILENEARELNNLMGM